MNQTASDSRTPLLLNRDRDRDAEDDYRRSRSVPDNNEPAFTSIKDDSNIDAMGGTWTGTSSIRGGSETTQMVLLTLATIGISYVLLNTPYDMEGGGKPF